MGAGKYSPTVSSAYSTDRGWWNKNGGENWENGRNGYYDNDGYDAYGYDENDVDRAGINELDYIGCGEWVDYGEGHYSLEYPLLETIQRDWGFKDGKPVRL